MSKGSARRDSSAELYRKDILGSLLEFWGEVEFEHPIAQRVQHADIRFRTALARMDSEDRGILGRMVELGECIIELYSHTPGPKEGRDCVSKHLNWRGPRENHAKRNRKSKPPPTHLWIISPGRPRALIQSLGMVPMEGWPEGFWELAGDWNAHMVVVRDLPETPGTLFLRLLGHRTALVKAIQEIDALPPGSRARQVLTQVLLAWREEIFETIQEGNMLLPETKARYAEWERRVLQKGRQEGVKEGIEKGIEQGVEKGVKQGVEQGVKKGIKQGRKKGRQEIVLKMLALRFGPLPAAAERRVKRASVATLERWAERLLTAKSLDDVLDH